MKKWLCFALAVVLLLTCTACAGARPAKAPGEKAEVNAQMHKQISDIVLESEGFPKGKEAHKVLYAEKGDLNGKNKENSVTVYCYSLFGEFALENGKVEMQSGGAGPRAVTLEENGEYYLITSYWLPGDGAYYAKDLKENFPTPAYEALEQLEQTAETHNAAMAELEAEILEQLKVN